MAKVLCTMTNCKYCGRKSSVYHTNSGHPLYTCKRETIQIRVPHDPDSDLYDLAGNLGCCMYFEVEQC